jgi:hypothetical protein
MNSSPVLSSLRRFALLTSLVAALCGCLPQWFAAEGVIIAVPGNRCPDPARIPAGVTCRETIAAPSVTCANRAPVDSAAFMSDPRNIRSRHRVAIWRVSPSALPNGDRLTLQGYTGEEGVNVWTIWLANTPTGIGFRFSGTSRGVFPRLHPVDHLCQRSIVAASPRTLDHAEHVGDLMAPMVFRPTGEQRVNRAVEQVCDTNFDGPARDGTVACATSLHPTMQVGDGDSALCYYYVSAEVDALGVRRGEWSPTSVNDLLSLRSTVTCLSP